MNKPPSSEGVGVSKKPLGDFESPPPSQPWIRDARKLNINNYHSLGFGDEGVVSSKTRFKKDPRQTVVSVISPQDIIRNKPALKIFNTPGSGWVIPITKKQALETSGFFFNKPNLSEISEMKRLSMEYNPRKIKPSISFQKRIIASNKLKREFVKGVEGRLTPP